MWAFSIVLKHLKWYIATSEQLTTSEKEEITSSLMSSHRVLQKAEREEQRIQPKRESRFDKWIAEYNQRRIESGKKPQKERRIVDELIESIITI